MAELLTGVTGRAPLDGVPGKSGARLERVVIGGRGYVLKHLDLSDDWTMRASGSLRGAPLELWERGILAGLPGCFNQPIVGAAPEERVNGPGPARGPASARGCALLMHDVTPWLVPATDEVIPLGQHLSFLRHMAALHAAFWGVRPRVPRRDPGGAPLPRAVPLDGAGRAATEDATVRASGTPAGRPGLATARAGGT